jgi:GMP synthase (glutamine-hydrolysing)
MAIQEITPENLNPERFIEDRTKEISSAVGNGLAISALSGGVDSSAVTMLGHRALGERLKSYFIDNGLMRQGEPESIASIFRGLGVNVEIIDAKQEFFDALKGLTDPEEKREAIVQTFYKKVFGKLVKESGAKHLLQGTILTDVDEIQAGIKRQHNVFEQIGINPEEAFGYKIIEPLIQLRKPAVRMVAKASELPEEIYNRKAFLGPALAGRVIGEATPERVELERKATTIVEEELEKPELTEHVRNAYQYFPILHRDRVTGVREGKRDYGLQIELRSWDSADAIIAKPTHLPYEVLERIAERLTSEVPGVVSVTYNIATKPPSTIEVV